MAQQESVLDVLGHTEKRVCKSRVCIKFQSNWPTCESRLLRRKCQQKNIKGATSLFVYFERIGKTFQNRHFQSVSIYAILSYPCSFLLYINPLVFFFLSKPSCLTFPTLNHNLGHQRNDSKCRDVAPLKSRSPDIKSRQL